MSGKLIEINDAEQFRTDVLEAGELAAVVFWATWCPHCQQFKPTFEGLADEYAGRIKFACVDTDKSPDLESSCEGGLIPTVLVYQGGKVVHRFVNEQDAEQYRSAFVTLLD